MSPHGDVRLLKVWVVRHASLEILNWSVEHLRGESKAIRIYSQPPVSSLTNKYYCGNRHLHMTVNKSFPSRWIIAFGASPCFKCIQPKWSTALITYLSSGERLGLLELTMSLWRPVLLHKSALWLENKMDESSKYRTYCSLTETKQSLSIPSCFKMFISSCLDEFS